MKETNTTSRWFSGGVLLLLLASLPDGHGFTAPEGTRVATVLFASHVLNEGAPNLYTILGASPKDTDQELKRKWQQLARRLHPDANIQPQSQGRDNPLGEEAVSPPPPALVDTYPYELSDVNAAWGILSNPKERRRYDRELQAQEVADTFEILLDAGIKTAIPFFKKTADNTMAAVETSSKVMFNVNKRMSTAAAIFDLETESKNLEKKATNAQSRMQMLRSQLETQKHLDVLQTPNAKLSSAKALQLLNKFAVGERDRAITTNREIAVLQEFEFSYREHENYHLQTTRAVLGAQKAAADAIQTEQLAEERLAQAKRDLAQAQSQSHACQKAQFNAVQQEKVALADAQQVEGRLNQQTAKVRYVLRTKESESLSRQATSIQEKLRQLQQSTQDYKKQAYSLQHQANQMRQEERQRNSQP